MSIAIGGKCMARWCNWAWSAATRVQEQSLSAGNLHNAASILRGPEVCKRRVEAVRKRRLRCVRKLNLQPALLDDEPGLGCPAEQKAAKRAKRPPSEFH